MGKHSYVIQALDKQIEELQKQLSALIDHRNDLVSKESATYNQDIGFGNEAPESEGEYIVESDQEDIPLPKLNWKLLALGVLKSLDNVSTTNEIYERLLEERVELKKHERSKVIQKLSGGLTKLVRLNKAKKAHNSLGKGNFWGLSDWFESENVINEKYKQKLCDKYGIEEDELFDEI